MSSTPWLSILIGLALIGCGESNGGRGTSESAATGRMPSGSEDVKLPVIDLSIAAAVSLVHPRDSGLPAAGKGGAAGIGGGMPEPSDSSEPTPPIDIEPISDAGVSAVDAALVEPAPDAGPPPTSELPSEPVPEPQVERCGIGESCDLKCKSAVCEVSCDDADSCKVECGEDTALCRVSCVGTKNCEPRCRGERCEIDCTEAEHCDHLKCEDGAACLARCAGASHCRFEGCDEPLQCAGDIIVCNRACPAE